MVVSVGVSVFHCVIIRCLGGEGGRGGSGREGKREGDGNVRGLYLLCNL